MIYDAHNLHADDATCFLLLLKESDFLTAQRSLISGNALNLFDVSI